MLAPTAVRLPFSSRDRPHRQMRQSQQSIVVGPRQRTCQFKALEAIENFLEDHFDLKPCEIRTETEMRSQPEADVVVRIASNVEAKRILEGVLVAIRRHLPH